MKRTAVLFVCMGNICRSPAAEAIFRSQAQTRGVLKSLSIDSCGTGGWHAGEQADRRMRKAALARGIEITSRARQLVRDDLHRFDHILCMDGDNLSDVRGMGADVRARRMLEHHPHSDLLDVPDPYYGAGDGFERVLDLLEVACLGLLDHVVDPKA
jgi:protein-tyrosine phosphatase